MDRQGWTNTVATTLFRFVAVKVFLIEVYQIKDTRCFNRFYLKSQKKNSGRNKQNQL